MTEEKLHDRRGGLALGVLSLVGLGISLYFAFTEITFYIIAEVTVPLGFSLALLVAALMRLFYGRPLKDGAILTRYHQEVGSHLVYNILRIVGLAIDLALLAGLALGILLFLDEFLPRSVGFWTDWAYDSNRSILTGADFWRAAVPMMGTSDAEEILGPMLVAWLCGMLILVPAATWGATPGMLAFGFRWVRAKDGNRVGALHAFLRVLTAAVFAAPQAAIVVLAMIFGGRRTRRLRSGGTITYRGVRGITWKARRAIADLVARTETFRPSIYAGLDAPPAQEGNPD